VTRAGLRVVGPKATYIPVGLDLQWGPGRCPDIGGLGARPPEAVAFWSIDTQILMF